MERGGRRDAGRLYEIELLLLDLQRSEVLSTQHEVEGVKSLRVATYVERDLAVGHFAPVEMQLVNLASLQVEYPHQ